MQTSSLEEGEEGGSVYRHTGGEGRGFGGGRGGGAEEVDVIHLLPSRICMDS